MKMTEKHDICRKQLLAKIKKYCQFEKNRALQSVIEADDTLLNEYDSEGNLPVHICAENGSIECMKMICTTDRYEQISAKNAKGLTPLHLASVMGYINIMKLLVIMGESVNVTNFEKMTPLHFAAANGHAGACRWLLSNNADHTMLDVYGRTALDNARRYRNNPCIKVINNYQASKKTLKKQRSSSSLNDLDTIMDMPFSPSRLRKGSLQEQNLGRVEVQCVTKFRSRRSSFQPSSRLKDYQFNDTFCEDITEESTEDVDIYMENGNAFQRENSTTSDIVTSESSEAVVEEKEKAYKRWTSTSSGCRLKYHPKIPHIGKTMRKILRLSRNGVTKEEPVKLHKCLSYESVTARHTP